MVDAGWMFEHLLGEFFAALEACRVQPRRKAVHQLRTTTRRLEALLNAAKCRRGDAKFGRRVDRAPKALKPIRKAGGPVRDIDVQLGLLEDLLKVKGAGMTIAEHNIFNDDAQKLQAKLKKYRTKDAIELVSVIPGVEDEKLKRISPLQTDLSGVKWMSLLKEARSMERRSAKGLEIANPHSLHEYRKSSKSARYLAEMEQESAAAEQFAKRMKKVLDAIGGWHDWLLLTQFAKETLGKSSALANILKKERDRALRQAVGAVERLHRQA